MIAKLLLAGVFVFVACTTDVDDEEVDTFDASVVCPADGLNKYGMPNRGTFIDERDGQEYKYTTIGDQVWMAENLNYDAEYSLCYDKIAGYCEIFGRYYDLKRKNTSGKDSFDSLLHDVCPLGWHVPTLTEWRKMIGKIGDENEEITAKRLKSGLYWNDVATLGSDECDFSVLPTGFFTENKEFSNSYGSALFWNNMTAAESEITNNNYRIAFSDKFLYHGLIGDVATIRCLKD